MSHVNETGEALGTALPTISLGSFCLTAFALRRLGLNDAPMPFDWLATSPAMIRHCLDTDFSVLLDRTHYRSLTGQRGPTEPVEGCAHGYYFREHGLACVFNHNDPTRESDYRYLTACVERLRDLLSFHGLKVFVQVCHAYSTQERDFEATSSLLDRLTLGGNLLKIVVNPPNKLLSLPSFNVVATRGLHTLYRMQPTSRMTGVDFLGPVDREALDGLIETYRRYGRKEFFVDAVVSEPASVELNLALANARVMAHIADRGDIEPDRAGWTGSPRSRLPVQGLAIYSDVELIRQCLRYQVAETPHDFSKPSQAEHYLGTRGLGRPIYGVRILLSDTVITKFRVSLEATFIDGSATGPTVDNTSYKLVSKAPLEAIRLLITERR